MEFKEFSEFPNLEEEDFDIKSALRSDPNSSNEEDPYVFEEDELLDEDTFKDAVDAIEDGIDVDEESELEEDSLDSLSDIEPEVEEESLLEEDSLDDLADPKPLEEDITVFEGDSYDPSEWGLEKIESDLEEDIFDDNNIQNTLQRYNYDYRTLVMMLFAFSGDDEVMETLTECGLTQNDYYHPTAETFELMRNHMVNRHTHRM